ncbi:MAG: PH domain-containing protein [Halalkalicoccus sp.]
MEELPRRFGGSDWLDLGPDEEVLWAGHPSPVAYAGGYLLGALLVVVGAVGALAMESYGIVGVAAALVGLGLLALTHLRRISTGYVITSAEVYHKEGLVSRDVTQIRYERIQNTSFSQSVPERLLSYGDVIITSAGTGEVEIVLRSVPEPARLKRLLSEGLDAAHAGGATARSEV